MGDTESSEGTLHIMMTATYFQAYLEKLATSYLVSLNAVEFTGSSG